MDVDRIEFNNFSDLARYSLSIFLFLVALSICWLYPPLTYFFAGLLFLASAAAIFARDSLAIDPQRHRVFVSRDVRLIQRPKEIPFSELEAIEIDYSEGSGDDSPTRSFLARLVFSDPGERPFILIRHSELSALLTEVKKLNAKVNLPVWESVKIRQQRVESEHTSRQIRDLTS